MSYYHYHVFFCTNQREAGKSCCQSHNASVMRDYMKRRIKELNLDGKAGIRVNNAGCLDRCKHGPVIVIYPDATWYTWKNKTDIDEIISEHLQQGRMVERLRIL
ncbi:MAG: 2Fe-2S ferredoxin [Beggiatoa sp. IS2]|nr:MAG: 2Fe-2S ferredoxin [Beggiatoa sp. IS2]